MIAAPPKEIEERRQRFPGGRARRQPVRGEAGDADRVGGHAGDRNPSEAVGAVGGELVAVDHHGPDPDREQRAALAGDGDVVLDDERRGAVLARDHLVDGGDQVGAGSDEPEHDGAHASGRDRVLQVGDPAVVAQVVTLDRDGDAVEHVDADDRGGVLDPDIGDPVVADGDLGADRQRDATEAGDLQQFGRDDPDRQAHAAVDQVLGDQQAVGDDAVRLPVGDEPVGRGDPAAAHADDPVVDDAAILDRAVRDGLRRVRVVRVGRRHRVRIEGEAVVVGNDDQVREAGTRDPADVMRAEPVDADDGRARLEVDGAEHDAGARAALDQVVLDQDVHAVAPDLQAAGGAQPRPADCGGRDAVAQDLQGAAGGEHGRLLRRRGAGPLLLELGDDGVEQVEAVDRARDDRRAAGHADVEAFQREAIRAHGLGPRSSRRPRSRNPAA